MGGVLRVAVAVGACRCVDLEPAVLGVLEGRGGLVVLPLQHELLLNPVPRSDAYIRGYSCGCMGNDSAFVLVYLL